MKVVKRRSILRPKNLNHTVPQQPRSLAELKEKSRNTVESTRLLIAQSRKLIAASQQMVAESRKSITALRREYRK